jgi:hypothetical protein
MRANPMRVLVPLLSISMLLPVVTVAQKAALEQDLGSLYRLTVVNAEGVDVTTGVTLVLKKSGMTAGAQNTCANEYKAGAIALISASKAICGGAVRMISRATALKSIPGVGAFVGAAQGAVPATRPFVAGEKVWVTKIDAKDAVVFGLISDVINSVRYKAEIRFQKANSPEAVKQILAEVFDVAPAQAAPAQAPPAQAAPAQPPPATFAAVPYQPVAPAAVPQPAAVSRPFPSAAQPPKTAPSAPPPPADVAFAPLPIPEPPAPTQPTVAPGMTLDQVVALLGPPDTIANEGSQKIYSYKILKVKFLDGKAIPMDDSAGMAAGALLPYEIGMGFMIMIVGAAAYWIGRRHSPAHAHAAPSVAETPRLTHLRQSNQPVAPANASQRLDELEMLRDLGILSGDEFEVEKHKLRKV